MMVATPPPRGRTATVAIAITAPITTSIATTITTTLKIAPNPSENEPPYESTGEWKKGTTLITPNPSEKEPPN